MMTKVGCGYDATSQASNPDGSQDPDDGQGHGTHVAESLLEPEILAEHTSVLSGAFLVDIKVLTDSGGTNSQNSINGIQWMINNKDTDWGNGAKVFKLAKCHSVQSVIQSIRTMVQRYWCRIAWKQCNI